jgi:hypothetical protein
MLLYESNEDRAGVSSQSRFAEVGIPRDEVSRLRKKIREIASTPSGNAYLLPYLFIMVKDEDGASSFTHLNRTHESGCSPTHYDNIFLYQFISYYRKKAAL